MPVKTNSDTLIQRIRARQNKLKPAMRKVMMEIGKQIAEEAKRRAPKDTGTLAAGIRPSVQQTKDGEGFTVRIRPNAKTGWYGIFSEATQRRASTTVKFRTVNNMRVRLKQPYDRKIHLKHQPFMQPAYAAVKDKIHDMLRARLEELFLQQKGA
jgi:HK97 gp10 family phage protein